MALFAPPADFSDLMPASIKASGVFDQRQRVPILYSPVKPSFRSKVEYPKPASATARAAPVRTSGRRRASKIAARAKANIPIGTIR
jgi:hypothetical protein